MTKVQQVDRGRRSRMAASIRGQAVLAASFAVVCLVGAFSEAGTAMITCALVCLAGSASLAALALYLDPSSTPAHRRDDDAVGVLVR